MNKLLQNILALLILAAVPGLAAWLFASPKTEKLQPFEIAIGDPKLDGKVVWVDARSPQEYSAGHATNAIALNEENWDQHLGDLFAAWQPGWLIVVYCNQGCAASEKVAARLREMNLEPAYFLQGGYAAWEKANP